jgi:hypothetical protein
MTKGAPRIRGRSRKGGRGGRLPGPQGVEEGELRNGRDIAEAPQSRWAGATGSPCIPGAQCGPERGGIRMDQRRRIPPHSGDCVFQPQFASGAVHLTVGGHCRMQVYVRHAASLHTVITTDPAFRDERSGSGAAGMGAYPCPELISIWMPPRSPQSSRPPCRRPVLPARQTRCLLRSTREVVGMMVIVGGTLERMPCFGWSCF